MKKNYETKSEKPSEKGSPKVDAITFCRLHAVNRLYHSFIKKKYAADELKTEKEWEREFRSQKVID